jgi:peptidyl-tRNA hydrolase
MAYESTSNVASNAATVHVITDAGHTEFGSLPTKTCLAIGPDEDGSIDAVTGHLKLLGRADSPAGLERM